MCRMTRDCRLPIFSVCHRYTTRYKITLHLYTPYYVIIQRDECPNLYRMKSERVEGLEVDLNYSVDALKSPHQNVSLPYALLMFDLCSATEALLC